MGSELASLSSCREDSDIDSLVLLTREDAHLGILQSGHKCAPARSAP